MKAATLNDADRSEWIDNDESLYNWWRSSRVSKRAFIKENRAELDAAIRSVRDRKPGRDQGSQRDRLTTRQRERLPASQFALPERRALPIHDAAHVRNAAARLEQMRLRRSVTPREHSRAMRAIQAREAQLGIGPFREPRRDPKDKKPSMTVRATPQRFREKVRELKREHAEAYRKRSVRALNPRAELVKIRPLLAQAKRLSTTSSHLDAVERAFARASDAVRTNAYDAGLSPDYVLASLQQVQLRPAFEEGDRTPRGIVESVGEYSRSDGWLYGVRNERGVFDRVWESTLVYR